MRCRVDIRHPLLYIYCLWHKSARTVQLFKGESSRGVLGRFGAFFVRVRVFFLKNAPNHQGVFFVKNAPNWARSKSGPQIDGFLRRFAPKRSSKKKALKSIVLWGDSPLAGRASGSGLIFHARFILAILARFPRWPISYKGFKFLFDGKHNISALGKYTLYSSALSNFGLGLPFF